MVSFCFCLFGEFAKVFDQVAHLHSGARAFALSGPSRCFQLSTNLDIDFFRYLLCWAAATIFTTPKGY